MYSGIQSTKRSYWARVKNVELVIGFVFLVTEFSCLLFTTQLWRIRSKLFGQRFPQLSGPSLPLCMGSAATVEAATAQREAYPCLQVAALFALGFTL